MSILMVYLNITSMVITCIVMFFLDCYEIFTLLYRCSTEYVPFYVTDVYCFKIHIIYAMPVLCGFSYIIVFYL